MAGVKALFNSTWSVGEEEALLRETQVQKRLLMGKNNLVGGGWGRWTSSPVSTVFGNFTKFGMKDCFNISDAESDLFVLDFDCEVPLQEEHPVSQKVSPATWSFVSFGCRRRVWQW